MTEGVSDAAAKRAAAAAAGKRLAAFDYALAAELFPTRSRWARVQPIGYKRFVRAADAIRFAIEDLSPELLAGAFLEIDGERFDGPAIRPPLRQRPLSARAPCRAAVSGAPSPASVASVA